jgi:hypothetical protein
MSLRAPPTGRSSLPKKSSEGRVHLYNEESKPRNVVVVIRRRAGGTSAERVSIPAGGAARVGLPGDDRLTVGCHSDDGRSGVRTCRPDGACSVSFSLSEGSMLVSGG